MPKDKMMGSAMFVYNIDYSLNNDAYIYGNLTA